MTVTQTRWTKTNPDCPITKHTPTLDNYRRGCECPQTYASLQTWAARWEPAVCKGQWHGASHNAWRAGCRHAGALIAHEEYKLRMRAQRAAALITFQETGTCGATVHGSQGAYRRGCRCPEVVARFAHSASPKISEQLARLPGQPKVHPWRGGKLAVNRNNLWFLVHGVIDNPTTGERIAAMIILSQRGSDRTGLLDDVQIAERLAVNIKTIKLYRSRVRRLREERPKRRLYDVREKAKRVARAVQRQATGS